MKIFKWTLTLFFCLAVSLYAADWTGSSSVPKNTKNIDGKAFYVITSAEELTWFAEQVNGGASEINAILANDIHFMDDTSKISTLSWTPIGKDSSTMFNGIFDGAGRTICGLYSAQTVFSGIFGVAGENALIKNVKSAKTSVFWGRYSGGIVAFNNGKVENCENEADLGDGDHTGGIVGWNAGMIAGCRNSGWVSRYLSHNSSGGIAGWNEGTISDCTNGGLISNDRSTGGIVGQNEGTVSGCTNSGSVSGGGGIAGWNEGTVSGCTNSGSVSGGGGIAGWNEGTISDCTNGGLISNDRSTGGIVGQNEGTVSGCTNSGSVSVLLAGSSSGGVVGQNEGTVSGCTNSGLVSGSDFANNLGGIVGLNKGTVAYCTNRGAISSTGENYSGGIAGLNEGFVRHCANSGTVVSTVAGNSGGLVGENASSAKILNSFSVADSSKAGVVLTNSGIITNCYYDSEVLTGLSTESPNMGLLTSDMQSDRFAWILNTTNGDSAHSGVWSRDSVGYPIFADSLHKPIYKVVFDDSGATSNRFTNHKGLISFPENPEPLEGEIFFGWYTDDNVKVKETTVFTKDQTVYAVYCEPSSCPPEPSDALVANLPSPAWSVTAAGRNFRIHVAPIGKPYALFDLQGKVLAKGRIESSEMTISAPRAGSYIVRIGNHSVRVNAK